MLEIHLKIKKKKKQDVGIERDITFLHDFKRPN